MSIVTECCIRSYCINAADEALRTKICYDLWENIIIRFHIPGSGAPLVRKEFLTHCISNGCAFTAYVLERHRMSQQQDPIHEVERELGQTIVPQINMFSLEQLMIHELFYRNRVEGERALRDVLHQEVFLIPLWILLMDLTTSGITNNDMVHRPQFETVIRFVDMLLRISGDHSTEGVASRLFGKVGGLFSKENNKIMKQFKSHSNDFKDFVVRPLALFLLGRTHEWHPNPIESAQEYQKLLTSMKKKMNGIREASDKRKAALEMAINEYIEESSSDLHKASELLRRLLVLVMFPNSGLPLWLDSSQSNFETSFKNL